MAIRKIIYIPDPRLRKMSKPVEVFDEALHTLIDDMFETMYHAKGVGLAAPQIGINIRLSVVDCSSSEDMKPLVLVNPEIVEASDIVEFKEGCLSVPGSYDIVKRPSKVKLRAQDRHGAFYEMNAEGLLAECFQHEIDHLDGKLYIDYLSPVKRQLARQKVEKIVRQNKKK